MPNAKARGVTAAPSSDLPTLIVRERPTSWPKASHANFSCSGARHEAIIAGIHSQRTAGHLRAELVQADLGMEYTAKRCSFILCYSHTARSVWARTALAFSEPGCDSSPV